MYPFGETVIRQRGVPVADPYSGEPTGIDWSTPDELYIYGCAFNPGGSTEPTQEARNAVITRPEVYAPAGADILAGDRLVVREKTYDIEGDPAEWRSPFTGWEPGVVVALERVDG